MIASTLDWVSAVSTAVIGVLGLVFTVGQYVASSFRPKISARVDVNREALEVTVVNRGRGGGVVHAVEVVDADGLVEEEQLTVKGFPCGTFIPTELPPFAAMRLVIVGPAGFKFGSGHRVEVTWATDAEQVEPLPVDASLAGLDSILPPRG